MKHSKINQPSESELEILQILWEHEPATVRQVFEHISAKREVSYTTILTFLQRMTAKNMVTRTKEGKTHYYTSVPKESEVQESLSKRLLNTVYKGSGLKMALHALGQSKVAPEELEALQQWLASQKQEGDE
ncbi:MAG: BlaI/MecI/CopY family transcriptional regulator [Bacteroidota bacterium]